MNTYPAPAEVGGLSGLRGHRGLPPRSGALRAFIYCRKSTEEDNRQVQSIERQRDELLQAFGGNENLEIAGLYEEAMSAKTEGRPVFGEMMRRIEKGEANCIIAWAPDRLARNASDGARIIRALDNGTLRDLKFKTQSFENNATGKFILGIMFGQSKYYSDALSDSVKSGNRKKAALGWRPNSVPLGYRHDHATRGIAVDESYFPFIRRMFDLMLTGGYSSRRIAKIARDEWGLRSPSRWKRGGKPLAPSTVHRILTNPFYAGLFTVQGEVHEGRHQAMLSPQEFETVQAQLRPAVSTRSNQHSFALTGLIKCGRCGRGITAERKMNRHGASYTYYHCSKSGLGARCPEPSVRAEDLEAQVVSWFRTLAMRPDVERRLKALLETHGKGNAASDSVTRQSLEHALRETRARSTELIGMRERLLITDEEFSARRAELQAEALRLSRRLEALARPVEQDVIPPYSAAASFNNYAADCFAQGDDELKRQIAKIAWSNPTLTNKILSVEAARWIALLQKLARCPFVRGRRDNLRTLPGGFEQRMRAAMEELNADSSWQRGLRVLDELRTGEEYRTPSGSSR